MQRALGDEGFAQFQQERGVAEEYSLTPVQADAILQDDARPAGESRARKARRRARQAARRDRRVPGHPGRRATDLRASSARIARSWPASTPTRAAPRSASEEIGDVDIEDLIEEETMVVSISHNGYIKRTPSSVYRAQRRGGKGITGRQGRRGRSGRAPVRHQHARLPAVLHQQGQGLLAEGVQPAAAVARRARAGRW